MVQGYGYYEYTILPEDITYVLPDGCHWSAYVLKSSN